MLSTNPFEILFNLEWYRITFSITNTRYIENANREKPVSIVNAIVKGISIKSGIKNVVFQLPPGQYAFETVKDKTLDVAVLIYDSKEQAQLWAGYLAQYFFDSKAAINFKLVLAPVIEKRNYKHLYEHFITPELPPEICLQYKMPLPFLKDNKATYTPAQFIHQFIRRFNRIFNLSIPEIEIAPGINILTHFQKEIKGDRHVSKSAKEKEVQWLQGLIGNIYISGNYAALLPLFLMGAEWNSGGEVSNSMGFYSISVSMEPLLDLLLKNEDAQKQSVYDLWEETDHFENYVSGFENEDECKKHLVTNLKTQVQADGYEPHPSTVFNIKKNEGGSRVIEQLHVEDLILQHFLLKQLSPFFEKVLEQECIGFRKGMSRKKAGLLFEQAVQEGFQYLIHTDIEDFFPSVSHAIMEQCLSKIIPATDTKTKQLLLKCIKTPFLQNAKIVLREKGLMQGSPLSPLLGNIYLDTFDEYIQSFPVRLIRFADDLLILCTGKEQAEDIFEKTGHFLNFLELHLKKSKTDILAVTERFHFLGLEFVNGRLADIDEKEMQFKKKPVYISEAYLFLSHHKGILEVRKYGQLKDSIPLNKISAILSLYQVSISGALIKNCLQQGIPVTLTLSSAYHMTTIKPNTKTYHDTMLLHGAGFFNLSGNAVLAIAMDIAKSKIENLVPLFQQRYAPGTNDIINFYKEGCNRFDSCATLDEVRGVEAWLTKAFYRDMNSLISEMDFKIIKRERKINDPINALLNFSSYLLFAKINAAVRALGLNPYLGFLHSHLNTYESLVCDIQELFRGRIYRLLLRVINLKVIRASDFENTERGMFLAAEARKKFILQFEKELNMIDPKTGLSLREHIYAQVVIIKNWAVEEKTLKFYKWSV